MTGLREDELESEFEEELELEGEWEGEWEEEDALGTVGRGAAGEFEYELEGEFEEEYEGEEFFRRLARRALRGALPALRRIGQIAAPIVGTAVGGPLGGMLGRAAGSLLREGEFEEELEGEFEYELEGEFEEEFEEEAAPATPTQAAAELMAAVASQARTSAEAEAMAGAATVASIPPADRAALRQVLPHMVRGTAVLTRVLRQRPATRVGVRAVPQIARTTGRVLARRAAAGQPVTRRTAARVMAGQTRRVLGNPRTCSRAIQRNVRATRAARSGAARRVPAMR
jgi:hypothetical protein